MRTEPGILFVNQHYAPDVASSGQHLTDLAEHLAEAGHDVEVWCGRGRYGGGGQAASQAREVRNGVRVRRFWTPGLGRVTYGARLVDYAAFFLQTGVRLLVGRPRELTVFLTTPPLLAVMGLALRALRGGRYVVWSLDLHPETEAALDILDPGGRLYRWLQRLSDRSYRNAEVVVGLGPAMARRLREKGVPERRIRVLPVWNRAENVAPVPRDENQIRRELGLGDRFVVMYSGNAGLAHRFEEVLEAAARLEPEGVVFLFVGDGARRNEIVRRAAEHGLENLIYRGYAPRSDLARSLSAGDVHLLTLRTSMSGIVAPGKIYGIMGVGRPVLMVGPGDSDPGQVIRDREVGRVIEPGPDAVDQLVSEIRRLRNDAQYRRRLGVKARGVFLERFERRVVCDRWLELVEGLLANETAPPSQRIQAA